MFKNKRIISLFLMMLMVVGMATSVYASKSDVTSKIEPRAILCEKCKRGYMVNDSDTETYTITKYGRHTREDGTNCSLDSVHTETIKITSRYTVCGSCGYSVQHGQTKSSSCK